METGQMSCGDRTKELRHKDRGFRTGGQTLLNDKEQRGTALLTYGHAALRPTHTSILTVVHTFFDHGISL